MTDTVVRAREIRSYVRWKRGTVLARAQFAMTRGVAAVVRGTSRNELASSRRTVVRYNLVRPRFPTRRVVIGDAVSATRTTTSAAHLGYVYSSRDESIGVRARARLRAASILPFRLINKPAEFAIARDIIRFIVDSRVAIPRKKGDGSLDCRLIS